MVFEKDGSAPIWNEILYGRAGYLYSVLLVQKLVPQFKDESFVKRVTFLQDLLKKRAVWLSNK